MNSIEAKRFKKIFVEITNSCNQSCPFCPGTSRQKTEMCISDFRKIAEQVRPLTDRLYLHVMGEPLLHSSFEQIIGVCEELDLALEITTNGSLLGEVVAENLYSPAVKQINISFHALQWSEKDAEKKRLIDMIFAFTAKAFTLHPDLYINYRFWGLCDFAGDHNDLAWMLSLVGEFFGANIPDVWAGRKRKGLKITNQLYLHFDTKFIWPEIGESGQARADGHCYGLVSQLAVLVDGTVVPCCLDRDGVTSLGNCLTNSLENIIESPKAKAIVEGFLKGRAVELLCQHCHYRRRFRRMR